MGKGIVSMNHDLELLMSFRLFQEIIPKICSSPVKSGGLNWTRSSGFMSAMISHITLRSVSM